MAQRRAGAGWLVAVAVALTVLVSTGVWNPFPDLWTWINTSGPLADPTPRWQQRLGGTPQTVTLTRDYVVVEYRDAVEVLDRSDGRQRWKTNEADWAAVVGKADRPYIVTGRLLVKGYKVLDPVTRTVVQSDETASAVWTYQNEIVDVTCGSPTSCEVIGHDPLKKKDDAPHWRASLPGMGFVLFADNPELLGTAQVAAVDRIAVSHEPGPRPQLLAFPVDGRVYIVNPMKEPTMLGPPVEPGRRDRVVVAGGRVVTSTAAPREGGCDIAVTAREAESRGRAWGLPRGEHLRTFDGGGCDQRRAPAGTENALVAVTVDGREQLIEAGSGKAALVCKEGERIVAVTGGLALVRSADGRKLSAYAPDIVNPGKLKPLWQRGVHPDASAAIRGDDTVVIADRGPDRVIVLDADKGDRKLEIKTDAEVVAVDDKGLVLSRRRDLGYVAFG